MNEALPIKIGYIFLLSDRPALSTPRDQRWCRAYLIGDQYVGSVKINGRPNAAKLNEHSDGKTRSYRYDVEPHALDVCLQDIRDRARDLQYTHAHFCDLIRGADRSEQLTDKSFRATS